MKKVFCAILSVLMVLSLCACGGSGSNSGAGAVPENKIDFNPSMDLDISIDPIGDVPENVIEFDAESLFDFEFTVDPVEVNNNIISFEFADFHHVIDVETFDADQFVADVDVSLSEEVRQEIGNMELQAVVEIAQTRADLLADLAHAFKSSGLDVCVDEASGEIMLDSAVLFDVNQYELSAEGRDFLQKFLVVYTTVVFNPKYEGFLSTIQVEGHTDSNGEYDYNLTLSQQRADSVLEFCLSDESCVDPAYIALLQDSLEAIGYSCDRLIYDANGNEDRAASRRVSFRFLIALPD